MADCSICCTLRLLALNVELAGGPTFGGYRVDTAVMHLASPQETKVAFKCDRSSCIGTFEFGVGIGNPLEMNLSWDQTTIATQSVGGGSMLLSNGPAGLGGLETVYGELEMDTARTNGSLRLMIKGADNLGGSFASIVIDATGPIARN